jgi:hypothetical protein
MELIMKPIQLPIDFTCRPPTAEDIPAVTKLINDYTEHFLGYREVTENDIKIEWAMPKFDPISDIRLVFNPAAELVGYIEVWTDSDPPVHRALP